MKAVALGLAMVLQVSGLWPHLPAATRQHLSEAAVGAQQPVATAPQLAQLQLTLPVQLGAEPFRLGAGTSAVAIDHDTATVLYNQNATKQRPLASITKIVTILTILSRHSISEMVTVGQLPSYEDGAVLIGLRPGETYRLGDLVKAALIPSANDAADALGIYDAGSITAFTKRMNQTLATWDIQNTHFNNDNGLSDDGNYTTATALGQIAMLALKNQTIRDIVHQPTVSITSTAGRTLSDSTTNELLASGKFYGIKTGYTLAAGECFLGLTKVNGHEIITVILGSSDRFGETDRLVNWIGRNYQWL
jgi:D-alanyl-D-alanine carboxypeptidase (penicillin-binding protein 5/6)